MKTTRNKYCTNVEFASIQNGNLASIVSYRLAIFGKVMEININTIQSLSSICFKMLKFSPHGKPCSCSGNDKINDC